MNTVISQKHYIGELLEEDILSAIPWVTGYVFDTATSFMEGEYTEFKDDIHFASRKALKY